jgi:large subunit ribosomal protein L33
LRWQFGVNKTISAIFGSLGSFGNKEKGLVFMREIVTLQCGDCKERNYSTTKNKKTTTGRLEFKKFCKRCRKHTGHKEVK